LKSLEKPFVVAVLNVVWDVDFFHAREYVSLTGDTPFGSPNRIVRLRFC